MNEAEHKSERARVLVVECSHAAALQLTDMVEQLAFAACPAALSADEALHHAHAHAPDLVLLSLQLEHGLQVAKQLRRELDLRVVYVTDEADFDAVERAHQTLPYGYLSKPLRTFDLRCCLSLALQQRRHEERPLSSPLAQSLSARERAVLRLIALGHTGKDIADVLHIAKPTVDTYRRRLTEKLGIRERTELVRFASDAGLLGDVRRTK